MIFVLVLLLNLAQSQYHKDSLSEEIKKKIDEENDNVLNYSYVKKFNSKFLFDRNFRLQNIFYIHEEEVSPEVKSYTGTDMRSKFISADDYANQVVNSNGKYVGTKPFFIYWPKHANEWTNLPAASLNFLAQYF